MKYIRFVCLFIVGLFLIPKLVLAEDLPSEGVHYFLTYPNGEEVVTKNYEEAENPEEKLLYQGTTNENGQVILKGYSNAGELRIVQHVPNGYSTDVRELTIDLAENRSANFVDYKGSNPVTGQSLFFIVIIAIAIVVAVLLAVKGKKQVVYLIPIIFFGIIAFQVYAENENVVITIKDKAGKNLGGVVVEVYAKPTRVQAYPAVQFSANGGHFFDGTTEMYYRLPSASCSWNDFMASLSENEQSYIRENIDGAYREGYYVEVPDFPEVLTNDTVITVGWEEDLDATYLTVHGNGGYYDFYGRKLDSIKLYNIHISNYNLFVNGEKNFVGYDVRSSCEHYDQYGIGAIEEYGADDFDTIYACWHDKPDGLYVNGHLFVGNATNCFNNMLSLDSNNFTFGSMVGKEVYVADFYDIINEEVTEFSISFGHVSLHSIFDDNGDDNQLMKSSRGPALSYEAISSLEIVKDGNVIVSLGASDLSAAGDDLEFVITNSEKRSQVKEYLSTVIQVCFGK